jgi:cell division protein FtsW
MRAHHPDYVIALVITILLAIGLVMMYSISPILSHKLGAADRNYYFLNQIKYVALGHWCVDRGDGVPVPKWRVWAPRLLVIAVISLVALLIPGLSHSSHGATRWLDLGPISVQPAEILKVALILYLAMWFEKHAGDVRSLMDGVVPFMIMAGAACFVIVVLQRDMGTMMVLALALGGMFFAAGMRWTHLGLLLGAGGAAFGVAMIAAFQHRMDRMTAFCTQRRTATGWRTTPARR